MSVIEQTITIPFNDFTRSYRELKKELLTASTRVLESGNYILGAEVAAFEESYSLFNETKHCIGVANGLDALHIALQCVGVEKGDEVILPSNTYVATVLAVSQAGATPVFVEPNIHTYNIEAESIAEKITSRTKAIVPVHLYGQACRMTEICDLAKTKNIFVIEDNAQAQGASETGKRCGSFGNINATSFYPTKNLGAFGDAGAITTDDDKLALLARSIRNYGSSKKYFNETIGMNSRLDELQAALLSVKLRYLEKWNNRRSEIALQYQKALENVGDIILPEIADNCSSVWHLFVIRTSKRNELMRYLAQHSITTSIHYPVPPYLQKAYSYLGFSKGAFPIADQLADTSLSLPLYPELPDENIEYVIHHIREFFAAL